MKLKSILAVFCVTCILAIGPVGGDWSMFQYIEMDAMNETLEVSPVQIMFLALFVLFCGILAILEYLPIPVTPQLLGRSMNIQDVGSLLSPPGHLSSIPHLKGMWNLGKALVTTDYASCMEEAICEYDELTLKKVRKKWDDLEQPNDVGIDEISCGQKYQNCPLSFKRLMTRLLQRHAT